MSASVKQCDLCEGTHFETVGQLDRKGKPLETVVCNTCGLIAHRHIPSEEELAAFYATDYRKDYHGEITPSARRVMRAWKNGQRIHRRLSAWLKQADRVFEVGAGIGCTDKAFEQGGCRASGIEPNQGFHAYSRDQLRTDLKNDYLFDLPAVAKHDMALLVHVIEHFRSPREAMQHLHKIIRPDGLLYVECPNVGAPFATQKRLFHFAHIHNFTPATLEMMAAATGFEVVQWFTDWDSPNLEVLLRKVESSTLTLDMTSYDRTKAALQRYNWTSYHARPRYMSRRIGQIMQYMHEHATADRFVKQLLAEIEREPQLRLHNGRRAA
jgi:SAM-dependent methyltransferase